MLRKPKPGQRFYSFYRDEDIIYTCEHFVLEVDAYNDVLSTSNDLFFNEDIFSTKAGARKNALKVYELKKKGLSK